MEIDLNQNILQENNLEIKQNKFLDSAFGNAISKGIDIGIRFILPDYAEDFIIDIKDNLMKYGLKNGISQTIKNAMDIGKSALGIVTGKFDNINQINDIVKTNNIIDGVSGLLDVGFTKLKNNGKIDNTVYTILKSGKNSILNNVEKNIQKLVVNQISSFKYLNKYINNWKNYYKEKDLNGMEKEMTKLKKEMKKVVPFENTIKAFYDIQTLHSLIKENNSFDLSDEEIELAKKLSIIK